MQLKLILLPLVVIIASCNNSGSDNNATKNENNKPADQKVIPIAPETNTVSLSGTMITVEGKDIKLGGSLLVQKDKDKLQPGNDYQAMLTASGGAGKESLTLNFLLATKTGTYPVVGMSFRRGEHADYQMFGGLLGGKPKLTDYKVNITECKDLGSNNMGGHRWSISGSFEGLVIPALEIMLMDKTKNHPKEIKIDKGSFSNLSFDDNWDDLIQQGMKKIQGK